MKKLIQRIILFLIPTIFIFFGLNFNRAMYGGDPEYAYLLNGLMIDNGDYVGHFDNPGTTVQIYSAIMLPLSNIFVGNKGESLQTNVLKNPDIYIEIQRNGFVILNGIFFLIIGLLIFYLSGNIFYALILQLTPFLSSDLIEHAWTKTSPEPMLILTVSFLIIALLNYFYSKQRNWKYYPIVFAAISGFGLATKATFFPLIFIALILLPTKAEKKKYIFWINPFFIFFTIPAIPQYLNMLGWFYKLLTHTGTYGHGSEGLFNISQYGADLISIFKNNIALAVSIVIFITTIAYFLIKSGFKSLFRDSVTFRLYVSVGLSMLIGVLFVAKHYHSNHYLVPENGIIGIFTVFLILFLKEKYTFKFIKLIPFFFLILFITGSIASIPNLKYADWGYIETDDEYFKINARLENEFKDYTQFYLFPLSLNKCSALKWGNINLRQKFTPELEKLYPKALFFNPKKNIFEFWETAIPASEILNKYGDKILFTGMPITDEEKTIFSSNGIFLENVYEGRVQSIYKVDTVESKLFE